MLFYVPPHSDPMDEFLSILYHYVSIVVNVIMYKVCVYQVSIAVREWHAIAYLTSLHWHPVLNPTVYVGFLLEFINALLFNINLYFVIVRLIDRLND